MIDPAPVRDTLGRLLDGVTADSTDEEIAEAIARRDAADARAAAERRRLGIVNGTGPGWGEQQMTYALKFQPD